jgi:hypothetical protein
VLPNGNYRATLPAGSVVDGAGNALAAPYVFEFFVLNGDANHDRYVDAADQAIVTANMNQPGTFADGDFNADGVVNSADQAYLTANWQVYLPAHGAWTLPATGGDDAHALRRESPSLLQVFSNGDSSPTYRAILGGVTSIVFNGGGGEDTLTIDHRDGNPIESTAVTFDGGAGVADTLNLIGSAAADTAVFNSNTATLATTVNHTNVEMRTFDGAGGGDALTVNAGVVALAATQTLASLTIATGGAAQLDVRDHDVIINYDPADPSPLGTFDGTAYVGLAGHIAAGRIFSSLATDLHAIASAEAAGLFSLSGSDTADFDGHIVDATTVLLKFSYVGDADLNGFIDAADYGIIDNWVQFPGTDGYANGDFNYDGLIDAVDYGYIDNSIQLQGPPL